MVSGLSRLAEFRVVAQDSSDRGTVPATPSWQWDAGKQTFYLDVEDTYRGIRNVDMVPNLSPQNLVSVEIGKDFMLSHGYIKNDFDVKKWAAPEFLEQAGRELLDEQWKKTTTAKLPEPTELQAASRRVG